MAQVVVGPLLRHVGDGQATVWLETDQACQVTVGAVDPGEAGGLGEAGSAGSLSGLGGAGGVQGAAVHTFCVHDHHYALVTVSGLVAGHPVAYEVRLNGELVWPRAESPQSVIRIPTTDQPLRIAFGSCLANGPQHRPWTVHRRNDEQGLGPDALRALALRVQNDPATRPDALLLLGDQAYADSAAPELREWIRTRRAVDEPPGAGVADFCEYAELYRHTWSDPAVRWLFSTVPTAMIFDDHEIIDDWNISASWVDDIRRQPWWEQRVRSGLAAYWIYEHLGNLPPEERAHNEVLSQLQEAEGDAAPVLFEAARTWDRGTTGTIGARWSYRWDIGGCTALIVDSRNGRMLEPGSRSMLDDDEFSWLEEQAHDATGHLLIGSSVPWLLPRGLHDMEGWNEAVADGAWGGWAARVAEAMRRAADFEHWAAFRSSWQRLADLIRDKVRATGENRVASVLVLSGDVHYSYATRLRFSGDDHSPVWQLVSSPLRYSTPPALQRAFAMGATRFSTVIGRGLARSAFLPTPKAHWSAVAGPYQHNGVAELLIDGAHARVAFFRAEGNDDPRLAVAGEFDVV